MMGASYKDLYAAFREFELENSTNYAEMLFKELKKYMTLLE